MPPSVTYLGCKVDLEGLHPLPSKVYAVVEAPCPSNTKLKSYLVCLHITPNAYQIIITFNTALQTTTKRCYLAMGRRTTKCV